MANKYKVKITRSSPPNSTVYLYPETGAVETLEGVALEEGLTVLSHLFVLCHWLNKNGGTEIKIEEQTA